MMVLIVGLAGVLSGCKSSNDHVTVAPAWLDKFTPIQQQARTHTVKVKCLTPVPAPEVAKDDQKTVAKPVVRCSIRVEGQGRMSSPLLTGPAGSFDGSKWFEIASDEVVVTIYGYLYVSAQSNQKVEVIFDEGTNGQTTVTITGAGNVTLHNNGHIAVSGAADFDVKSNKDQVIDVNNAARAKVSDAGKVECGTAIVEASHCLEVDAGKEAALKATECGKVAVRGKGPNVAVDCGEVTSQWDGVITVIGHKTKTKTVWGGKIVTE